MGQWVPISEELPPDEALVDTKVHDENGARKPAKLRRKGGLFFFHDWSMYVYYTPTHWLKK